MTNRLSFEEAATYGKPIIAIAKTLMDWNVPFRLESYANHISGYQLTFPWCKGDIVCNDMSYGHVSGHVETFRFPWDKGDVTAMYPYEAACRVIDLYKELSNEVASRATGLYKELT